MEWQPGLTIILDVVVLLTGPVWGVYFFSTSVNDCCFVDEPFSKILLTSEFNSSMASTTNSVGECIISVRDCLMITVICLQDF